ARAVSPDDARTRADEHYVEVIRARRLSRLPPRSETAYPNRLTTCTRIKQTLAQLPLPHSVLHQPRPSPRRILLPLRFLLLSPSILNPSSVIPLFPSSRPVARTSAVVLRDHRSQTRRSIHRLS